MQRQALSDVVQEVESTGDQPAGDDLLIDDGAIAFGQCLDPGRVGLATEQRRLEIAELLASADAAMGVVIAVDGGKLLRRRVGIDVQESQLFDRDGVDDDPDEIENDAHWHELHVVFRSLARSDGCNPLLLRERAFRDAFASIDRDAVGGRLQPGPGWAPVRPWRRSGQAPPDAHPRCAGRAVGKSGRL